MSGGCCTPFGGGGTPAPAFYQTVIDTDGNDYPQQPNLEFRSSDFTPSNDDAVDATRIILKNPLPSPSTNQDRLGVAGGLWAAVANGFLQFATTTLRDAFPGLRTPGMLAYVTATQCLYMLAADLTTWDFFAPSPELQKQATWFVDVAAGNDGNSGLVGSPIKTAEELSRRLCPGGAPCVFGQNVTVNFAAGAYGKLTLNLDSPAGTAPFGFLFAILCAVTSTANMNVTVVNTNAATNTRGQMTAASGAFTAQKRIRVTSGAALGAIGWSTGQNASAQNHFVSTFMSYNANSNVNVPTGSNVVVDTLAVSFASVNVTVRGNGYFELHDASCPTGGYLYSTEQVNGMLNLVACEIAGNWYGGDAFLWQTRITAATTFNAGLFKASALNVQALLTIRFGASLAQDDSSASTSTVDGGKYLMRDGGQLFAAANVEFENGVAGNANEVFLNGYLFIGGKQWGASANYGVGYALSSSSNATTSALANLAIPATQPITMTGHNLAYAAVPLSYPRAACTFALNPDPAAVAVTT